MSLSKVFKEHNLAQNKLKQENERKKKAALASVEAVTNGLMDNVNLGVAHVFSNQKKLEQEARTLQTQTAKFTKQTNQWLNLIDNFNNSLKEIGDVDNWAKIIEKDMISIGESLEYVHKNIETNTLIAGK